MSDMLQSRVYPTFFTSPLASSGHWYEPYDSYHRCPPYEIENTFSVGRVPPLCKTTYKYELTGGG